MYIDLNVIYIILALLGIGALIFLIITLKNINEFIKNINKVVSINSDNIHTVVGKLPNLVDNISDISENVKDVSEVATDVTADIIVAKENVKSNVEIFTEILNILKSVFINK
ncbi:hypothetical protein [Romboutsia sp. 1001713B170131_170501_G6]|uniref:hypothetical protein n=1 Tax=Romboutsia sp. 1001713B170131_170501_G6 TaxID=2787108 RepID=UPI0018ABF7F4|nr:hypothetical protein [Romboutsia sp. 1001713B170131_170501_G6]